MRHWLARQMMKPWVAAIGCTALFVVVMVGIRSGLSALHSTGNQPLIFIVCAIALAVMFFLGRLLQRAGLDR